MNTFLNLNNMGSSIRTRSDQRVFKTYEIRAGNAISCNILIEYFSNSPLFSSKYLDYLDWLEAYKLKGVIKDSDKKTNLITNHKNNMNTKRINFNWDHLNKFYKFRD
ncbi:MAG: LAGLIDADG family homing endonuclease [Cellulophaga sp.]|nr:LAGLIDADG family homing endonuclease [Cellulophaga sp.]